MADFIFHCPHCHQSINAEDDWCGQNAVCPTCRANIIIKPDDIPKTDVPPEHENSCTQNPSAEYCSNTLLPDAVSTHKVQTPVFYQQNVLSPHNVDSFWKMAAACALLLLLGIFIVIAWPNRWEYKVLEITGEIKSYTNDDFKSRPLNKDSIFSSLNSGFTDWELVTAITEIETVHPNFGQSGYVTGIQPNIRTPKTLLLFRKRKLF